MSDRLIAINVSNQAQDDADGVHTIYAVKGMTLVGLTLCVEAFTGSPTSVDVDIQGDGTDIVTAACSVATAGTPGTWLTPHTGGTNSPVAIAASSEIEVDVNFTGGTSPTADYDLTLWFLMGEV